MSSFWLEYMQDGQRRQFSFDNPQVTVGRDKSADFVLDHPTVSRQHALIKGGAQGFQLVVLSQGGLTAIDGGQVQGEVQLYDGSEVHFGQLSFTFRSQFAAPKPDPTANPAISGFAPSALQASGPAPQQMAPAPSNNSSSGIDWNSDPAPAQNGGGGGAGWGNTNWDAPAAAAPEPEDDGGIVSWDQIANSAEAKGEVSEAQTDFQRIQAAQAKADKQTQGTSPVLIGVVVLAMLGMVAWSFWPADSGVTITEPKVDDAETPFIAWTEADIDCVGRANCQAEAIAAYKVANKLREQAGADITNPYESFKQYDRAQKLLEAGGIEELPADMSDVRTNQAAVMSTLDAKFRQSRVNYLDFQKRKNYKGMAKELTKLQAYFPDKRCKFYQWAVAKERKMKDDGVYPVIPAF